MRSSLVVDADDWGMEEDVTDPKPSTSATAQTQPILSEVTETNGHTSECNGTSVTEVVEVASIPKTQVQAGPDCVADKLNALSLKIIVRSWG